MIVSAFATRGLSADVMRLVLSEHELVTSRTVLEEVERVLSKKFAVPPELVAEALELLERHTVAAEAPAPEASPVSDETDARILAAAIAAESEILVTGDRDLLDVRDRIEGIAVTNPRGFWEMIRGGGATPSS